VLSSVENIQGRLREACVKLGWKHITKLERSLCKAGLKTNRHGSLREALFCCLAGIETNRFFSWTFVKVLTTRNFRERKKKLCCRELIKAFEEYYSGKER
jgi:hypothetical protein